VALTAPLLVLNLLWGAAYFLRRPPIGISYSLPLEVIDYGEKLVDRLQVTVTNTGDADLAPRFAVQRDPSVQALPWAIDSGPERLQPGQSGEYAIRAGVPIRAFLVRMGGQIVVTDAGGDYWQRVVQTIPPDKSFAYPDAIVNPEFKFWPAGGNAPEAWALQTTLGDSATAGLGLVEGKSGLTIQLDKTSAGGDLTIARLAQTIPFLEEFAVWVYPTAPATDPLQRAYGLELDDGEHKLWVLFGDSDDQGELGKDWNYIYLPAPLNTWSRRVVHPRKLYDALGWQVPSFSLRRRNGLEYLARQIQLSLLVASQSESSGVFGLLEQEDPASASDGLVSEALAHPDVYYTNLGSEYHRQRNYDLAQDAYREALARDAANAEAHFGLAEANFWSDDWAAAIEAFEASVRYGCRQPALAYRGLGWSYYNLDELVEAKRAFEKAISLAPDLADGYNGLGWVALRENDCDGAVRYFEQALALDPGFSEPQQGIEKCADLE
jgi:tetratricopeptide (TPR) repeat protein